MKIYIVTSQRVDYDDYPLGSESTYFVGTDLDAARDVFEQINGLRGYREQVSLSYYNDNERPEEHVTDKGVRFFSQVIRTRLTD